MSSNGVDAVAGVAEGTPVATGVSVETFIPSDPNRSDFGVERLTSVNVDQMILPVDGITFHPSMTADEVQAAVSGLPARLQSMRDEGWSATRVREAELAARKDLAHSRIPTGDELAEFPQRVEHIGTFDANNGIIVFVDESGVKRIAADTKRMRTALERAGYRTGRGMNVPFSNQEIPTDEQFGQQLAALKEEGRRITAEEIKAEAEATYAEAAKGSATSLRPNGTAPLRGSNSPTYDV